MESKMNVKGQAKMNVKGELTKWDDRTAAYWVEVISCRVNTKIIKFTEDTKLEGAALTSKHGEIILFGFGKVKVRAGNKIKFNHGKAEAAMPGESNLKHKYSMW